MMQSNVLASLRPPRTMLLLRCNQMMPRARMTSRNQNTRAILGRVQPFYSHSNHCYNYDSLSSNAQRGSRGPHKHRFFSNSRSKEHTGIPISFSSLPLFDAMVAPHLHTIEQLPEIQYALQNKPSPASIEGLKRGLDIFSQMKTGGDEHCAVLAFLADCYCRIGQYTQSQHVLKELQRHRPKTFEVNHSKAKVEWYAGYFTEASFTTLNHTFKSSEVLFNPLRLCATQNGMGLIFAFLQGQERTDDPIEMLEHACHDLLESINTPEETETDKNEERYEDNDKHNDNDKDKDNDNDEDMTPEQKATLDTITDRIIENLDFSIPSDNKLVQIDKLKLAIAMGFNNLGIALVLNAEKDGQPMSAWREGLHVLDKMKQTRTVQANNVRIRLLLNMAIHLLKDGTEASLKTASTYAKAALRLSENGTGLDPHEHQFILGRSLSVVATCFLRADSAVTAEGLFQSSLDALKKGLGPLNQLTLKDTYHKYAILCHKWDKRKSDAVRLEQERDKLDLPNGWRGQQEIAAGFLFFGTSDL